MTATSVTLLGRAAAERLMTNRVRVRRHTGEVVTDPLTGQVSKASELVYGAADGGDIAKITASGASVADRREVGGRDAYVETLRLDLPVRADCRSGDVVEVLSSQMDQTLVGLEFELVNQDRGEWRTAHRWTLDLVTR